MPKQANTNVREGGYLTSIKSYTFVLNCFILPIVLFSAFKTTFAQNSTNSPLLGYAIIATPSVLEDESWIKVIDALKEKYTGIYNIEVIKWDNDAFNKLQKIFPRYACFVVKPEEATRERLATIWQKTRKLDSDPYGDVIWGIITGYDAADALRLARVKDMTVETACAATSIATKYFKSSVVFDEINKNHWRIKKEGEEEEDRNDGPSDTTHAIANALNDVQLFVTSGHATENNWLLGYSYTNGYFTVHEDKLLGKPSRESGQAPFFIQATGSKIQLASGNCLWGHINKPSCMALMMIRHANVDMFMGYTVPTWFGYMGWGVQDYYIEQPGRFTVAEAFFANNQSLLYLIEKDNQDELNNVPNSKRLSPRKREGLIFDRDVVTLYGDPAWKNSLAIQDSGWKQTLTSENQDGNTINWTLTIEPLKGKLSFELIDNNGSERSQRPIIQLLPHRVSNVHIVKGQEFSPVITDNFVLIPLTNLNTNSKSVIKFTTKQ